MKPDPTAPQIESQESMSVAEETIGAVVDRLTHEGYEAQFRGEKEGLRLLHGGAVYDPDELTVEQMARFEGVSDPGEEAVVFALRTPEGVKGTWTVTYGPHGNDIEETDLMRRLIFRSSPHMA